MRVIAGKARRIPLKCIEGSGTRPTTDRIKETLFNMLSDDIPGCRFLDLFSGSGAIGIEALSRGAKAAVFVEKNRRAASCIRENLEKTRLGEDARLLQTDCRKALSLLEKEEQFFDIIFMDPPYNHLLEKEILTRLADSTIADETTLIIAEASLETDLSYLQGLGYQIIKEKKYKTNMHIFVRKSQVKHEKSYIPGKF